ncbi:MAG: hypothetical protein COB50_01395 [Thiotrichales bacterium]|nr:MAG: hypothetical protein COB50_01395 [Thiotrichales bacterium]
MKKLILYSTSQYQVKLKQLCAPLEKHFGITDVSFLAVQDKVDVINLHTNVAWVEHCLEQNYYNCDPLMVHPTNISSGFATWDSYRDGTYASSMLFDAIYKFNMCNGFSYVEKHGNSFQSFGFSADRENYKMQNAVFNNIKLLKNIIAQVQQYMQLVWKDLCAYSVNGVSLKGDLFHTQPGLVQSKLTMQEKLQFLQQIKLLDHRLKNLSISPQERRCIRLYLEGNTAAETAVLLHLSRRTVEGYMENIKEKLCCRYKKNLHDLLPLFECLNIIDYPDDNAWA